MKLTTVADLIRLADKHGYRELRIQRISQTTTGYALFGIHPDGHRGRINPSDVERAITQEAPTHGPQDPYRH